MLVGQGENGVAPERSVSPNGDAKWETFRRIAESVVMDSAGPAVWLLNARRQTTLVGRSVAELLGYSSDEMIGLDLLVFVQRGFEAEIEKALSLDRAQLPGPKEVPFTRKDGTVVWALVLLSPIFDGQGQYAGAVATLGDLTSQKRREDGLRGRVAQLEQASHAPRGTRTTAELVRGAVVLVTCTTFVATVALLTGWGVVSALVQRGERREDPDDWELNP